MLHKRSLILVGCGLLAMLLTSGAQADPSSCDIQGTWIGEVGPGGSTGKFFSTYHGRTRTKGTLELQFLDTPAALGGPFNAERFSPTKGVWKRTGHHTFVYTMVTYGVDSNDNILYSVENTGSVDLSKDCRSAVIEACAEYFAPDGSPIFCGCDAATATRLELKEPCDPAE